MDTSKPTPNTNPDCQGAQEKAKEMLEKFGKDYCWNDRLSASENRSTQKYQAKQCALICVDEILKECENYTIEKLVSERFMYWQQVKTAITNL